MSEEHDGTLKSCVLRKQLIKAGEKINKFLYEVEEWNCSFVTSFNFLICLWNAMECNVTPMHRQHHGHISLSPHSHHFHSTLSLVSLYSYSSLSLHLLHFYSSYFTLIPHALVCLTLCTHFPYISPLMNHFTSRYFTSAATSRFHS